MPPNLRLRDVRCPTCNRLQFKLSGPVALLERQCRCKTMFIIHGYDVMLSGASATVCTTFEGIDYSRTFVAR